MVTFPTRLELRTMWEIFLSGELHAFTYNDLVLCIVG